MGFNLQLIGTDGGNWKHPRVSILTMHTNVNYNILIMLLNIVVVHDGLHAKMLKIDNTFLC